MTSRGDFHAVTHGASGWDALREFCDHVASVPEGAHFETGIIWGEADGWCAYHRVGDKALRMAPRDARRIAQRFEAKALRLPISPTREWALDTARTLREIADEADLNNRLGKKPEGLSA